MGSKQKKVLIVEDEKPLSKVLKDNIETVSGIEVFQAYDGEEGLQKAIEIKPDLILLDVIMPKMDGVQFLQALRKHKDVGETRVVLLTNVSTDPTLSKLRKLRFSDYIVKSNWDINEVIERVSTFLY
jgi:two-component system, OmpR family, response regulator VicR